MLTVTSCNHVNSKPYMHDNFYVNHFQYFAYTDEIFFFKQKTDVLALLWQRMLEYAVQIHRRKETELHWSGHYTNKPLRTTTFEEEFTQLEVVQVSSLLCGIKVVAQSHGVHLQDNVIDKWEAEQNLSLTKLDKFQEDLCTFVVLNNFIRDFLQFSEEFFGCLE